MSAATVFEHYCTCGGFAAPMNGRDPADPHMSWCPQQEEYAAWWNATHPVRETTKPITGGRIT